jgi:hypothetical protein
MLFSSWKFCRPVMLYSYLHTDIDIDCNMRSATIICLVKLSFAIIILIDVPFKVLMHKFSVDS